MAIQIDSVPYGLSSGGDSPIGCKVAERFLSADGSDCEHRQRQSGHVGLPKSAMDAHSAARKIRAAGVKRARIPGRPTCAAKPTPSIGVRNCRWPRGFASTFEPRRRSTRNPGFDFGDSRLPIAPAEIGPRGFQFLRIERHPVLFDPALQFLELRDPTQLGVELASPTRGDAPTNRAARSRCAGDSPPRAPPRCQRRCSAFR